MSKISAAIVIIGNEILSGRTQDVNGQFLANSLSNMGIALKEIRIIPDIHEQIVETVKEFAKKMTYVFTTGGIGPTHDDITAKAIAHATNQPYVLNEKAAAIIKSHYENAKPNDARMKMAYMPQNAKFIQNSETTVPGFYVDNIFVLAGVPKIMQSMFNWLKNNEIIKVNSQYISEKIDFPKPESLVAEILEEVQRDHNELEIGSYPYSNKIDEKRENWGTEICIRGQDKAQIMKAKEKINNFINELLKDE